MDAEREEGRALVQALALARIELETAESICDELEQEMLGTEAYRAYDQARTDKRERDRQEQEAYAKLAAWALAYYEDTGDKAPVEHVKIAKRSRLLYDAHEALDWCHWRCKALLVLDAAKYEKVAPLLEESGAPGEMIVEPFVRVDRDLS